MQRLGAGAVLRLSEHRAAARAYRAAMTGARFFLAVAAVPALIVGCADLWGFHDLTVADGGESDATSGEDVGASDAPPDVAATDSTTAPDAHARADARASDGSGGDVGSQDAEAEACAPFPIDAACFGFPTSANVAVFAAPTDSGCGGSESERTPTPCLCDYSCACFFANASAFTVCPAGWGSCSEASGIPIVTCKQ